MTDQIEKEKRSVGAPKGSNLGHPSYPGSEKGGRPAKYTDEFIENEAEELLLWMKRPDSIYFKQFSLERGYHWNRCLLWAKKNEKFRDAHLLLKDWQESKFAIGGLTKIYDSSLTKFMMLNVCGMREEKNITVQTTGPIADWLVEASGKSKELFNNDKY